MAQGAGVILTLHHVRPARAGFAPNRALEVTPEFLDHALATARREGFGFVSMDEVPARIASGRGRPFVAVTFDDGYRDNLEHAAPVLRRHGVPWTVYVVPGYAEGRGRLWWVELERALARLDRAVMRFDAGPLELALGSERERMAAFGVAMARLRAGSWKQLARVVDDLSQQAGIDPGAVVRELCAGWDDIAAAARDPALCIGAHTLSHPILAKLGHEEAAREVSLAKGAVEARIGRPVRHLAYPHGDPSAVGPREFALAEKAGYTTAVTTRPGHLFAGHAGAPWSLPRVSVNGLHQTDAALRAVLSGAPFLGRRAA